MIQIKAEIAGLSIVCLPINALAEKTRKRTASPAHRFAQLIHPSEWAQGLPSLGARGWNGPPRPGTSLERISPGSLFWPPGQLLVCGLHVANPFLDHAIDICFWHLADIDSTLQFRPLLGWFAATQPTHEDLQ